ncbi:heparinase II/III family protein [Pseudophaeobacter flagellatus]|uniref:heparinase II/III family protein n=1 Tax=Pseudophaeobacter flagellatus TaxID=2899119 RepID=UPI001E49DE24|nr:heparinase II/III family protein [Pseudophaeobacter flagellatus]MCD9146928.1 heparinase II/III family protein [Pseudophaeobacter flagellatus]
MSRYDRVAGRGTRIMNRLYAWRARKQPAASGFVSHPEPRTIGSFARGRQLVAGNLLFAGFLVESDTTGLWDVTAPDAAFEAERQGFSWLDDLAAVGDIRARQKAQKWVWGWIETHGAAAGLGGALSWSPDLTGRRVIRWINHALFLLSSKDRAESEAFYQSLSQQTWFLSRRWQGASPGLPRFEALTGLIYAGLALQGREELADPAIRALAQECESQIDAEGGVPTRNPEELLEVFTLLTWAAAALHEAGRTVPAAQIKAIERIAPALRTLRHADGGLARFHGGGRGIEGWLDHALAAAHVSGKHLDGLAMGYARLAARRTSVVIDAAVPPQGAASGNGHASTLAFELTSGRRPLVVNCGSGETFGLEWRRAGRATPSHSTLCLAGHSSARLAPADRTTGQELLVEGPTEVQIALEEDTAANRFQGGHDGYLRDFGLTHARTLELSDDGRSLSGEDLLVAIEEPAKRVFSKMLDRSGTQGIGFELRLHLHPDVDSALDLGGAAVSMALKSGEIWVFRHDGNCELTLEPSVYLEKTRLKPRAAKQIVLSGRAIEYATRVRWTLSKAQETAIAVRDLNRDEPEIFD